MLGIQEHGPGFCSSGEGSWYHGKSIHDWEGGRGETELDTGVEPDTLSS